MKPLESKKRSSSAELSITERLMFELNAQAAWPSRGICYVASRITLNERRLSGLLLLLSQETLADVIPPWHCLRHQLIDAGRVVLTTRRTRTFATISLPRLPDSYTHAEKI